MPSTINIDWLTNCLNASKCLNHVLWCVGKSIGYPFRKHHQTLDSIVRHLLIGESIIDIFWLMGKWCDWKAKNKWLTLNRYWYWILQILNSYFHSSPSPTFSLKQRWNAVNFLWWWFFIYMSSLFVLSSMFSLPSIYFLHKSSFALSQDWGEYKICNKKATTWALKLFPRSW